jgi:hypothetical protein
VTQARFLRTHSLDATGGPGEVIGSFAPGENVRVGEYVEISETRYLVEAAWRAGKVPEIYNREAFDAPAGDTVARLRPIQANT